MEIDMTNCWKWMALVFALQCGGAFALSVTPTTEEMRANPADLAHRTPTPPAPKTAGDAVTPAASQDARAAEILAMRTAPHVNDDAGRRTTSATVLEPIGLSPRASGWLLISSIVVVLGAGAWAMRHFSRKFETERGRR